MITKLEAAVQNDDTTLMKSLTEEVKQAMMEIGQKVYGKTSSNDTDDSQTIETDFSVGN